jgi:hypothetical protein
MSSPGVMHVRPSEPIDQMLRQLLEHQKAREYPPAYNQARLPLINHLLSLGAASVPGEAVVSGAPHDEVDHLGFGVNRDPLGEDLTQPGPINDYSNRRGEPEKFSYPSSFDRLTLRKAKPSPQPTSLPMRMHLVNVLAVTAALLVGALIYVWAGGGLSGFSGKFYALPQNGPAKIRPIHRESDRENLPTRVAPVAHPNSEETRVDPDPSTDLTSSERLLYSTTPIVFTPLK